MAVQKERRNSKEEEEEDYEEEEEEEEEEEDERSGRGSIQQRLASQANRTRDKRRSWLPAANGKNNMDPALDRSRSDRSIPGITQTCT